MIGRNVRRSARRSVLPGETARERVASILRDPRYEVIPLPGVGEDIERHVPKEVKLTVTSSPALGVEATLGFAEELSSAGYRVAPHLAARLVEDETHLAEILARLEVAGVRELFVIAGDAEESAGEFAGAGELLDAMSGMEHGIEEVGISGYPESHPIISDEATIRAMQDKQPHATYMVSQICFDSRVTSAWLRRVRERGISLPLYIGLPGIVSKQKLMRVSSKIGLGESARFLRHHRSWLLKLFVSGGYTPDHLIRSLSSTIIDPESKVGGFHIYTFNDLKETERWRRETLERLEPVVTEAAV